MEIVVIILQSYSKLQMVDPTNSYFTWHQSPNSRAIAAVLSAFKSHNGKGFTKRHAQPLFLASPMCRCVLPPCWTNMGLYTVNCSSYAGRFSKARREGGKTVPKESSNYRVPIKSGFVKKEENLALPCLSPRFIPICRWVETPSDHLNTSEHLV